jgi:acetyltransferase
VAGKLGHDILYNLIHAGFPGPIFPINPKADQVLGLPAYKQIGDAPCPPDLAVVVIPARAVAGAIEQCGQAGVKGAIVITGGFAEAGPEGEKLQEELVQTARRFGVRLIGPNCQGLNNPHHKLCASWPLLTTQGGMAFISQSGTVGAALMDWASQEQLGVSVFLSLGNRADIDEADAIEYFNQDPYTKVIALYLEGVKRPIYFQDALAGATKPVVILKAGRTAQGRLAAESHTKSLAGSDNVYDAIFRKYKVHRADTIEELYGSILDRIISAMPMADSGCFLIEPYPAFHTGEDGLKAHGAERVILQWVRMSRAAHCQDRQQHMESEDPKKSFHSGKRVTETGDCKYPVDNAHFTLLPGWQGRHSIR